ncbi:ABC transporter permease [Streptomyces zagrosensis]|uniref:Putative ABC transport system permease protein n=1 Tax=Streptomyces zagrosensis TaxID=1042984 RepID=A0A7W9QIK1_9ACTN|nr:FtsX-like permease family protein [Streptomyces zagrosensis]MBB5940408.1 putative ABC transport system permease protein [Streptomyces zagrosensis]
MIRVAFQTLRSRWVSFLGTVVALVLGVAQVAAMGLLLMTMIDMPDRPAERFAGAPAVVLPHDPTWQAAHHDLGIRSPAEAKGVSPQLRHKVAAVGETVTDRAFYAQLEGGSKNQVGHPWPVARFGGYQLEDGKQPSLDTDVVVPSDQGHTGDQVTVLTADGVKKYTVSGTVSPVDWEDAVFFSDAEAAKLSPRVHALVALGPLDKVRTAVGRDAEVLTGEARHRADASEDLDREALDNTITLVPVMASVAGVTAIFVVASTFAFAVIQRRREIALLRAVGATPKQVRKMVRNEALLVGILASAIGTVLGLFGAQLLADMLIDMDISPSWFEVGFSTHWTVLAPLAGAFLVGLMVALGGASASSRRAGNIRPIEALREAAVDDNGMTRGRFWLGAAGVIGGVGWTGWIAIGNPAGVLSPTTYVLSLMVPVLAAAVVAPLLVGPLTKLLMWPFMRSAGPTAMLVRESVLTSRRRTAAIAAPVLLTVGLVFSLLAATDSLGAARDSAVRNSVKSQYALASDGTPGISPAVADKVSRIPGVQIAAPILTTIYTQDEDRFDENDALVVDPAALKRTMNLEIVDGSFDKWDDNSTVVADLWGLDVGSTLEIMMADGSIAKLRIAATYKAMRGYDVAYLTPKFTNTAAYARDGLVRRAYISLNPGTDTATATAAINHAIVGTGADFMTRDQLVASEAAHARHLTEVRQRSTAVIILMFCFIAILNTLLMATADRRRDLAVLRMAGATPKQLVKFFIAESLLVASIGLVLALVSTAVNLGGLWVALHQLFGTTPIVVPYLAVIAVAVVSTLLAVIATVLPVGAALRARTLAFIGARE